MGQELFMLPPGWMARGTEENKQLFTGIKLAGFFVLCDLNDHHTLAPPQCAIYIVLYLDTIQAYTPKQPPPQKKTLIQPFTVLTAFSYLK